MGITFEHVSADIQRDAPSTAPPSAPAPKAPPEDLKEPLMQLLRLRDERLARLCDE
jgi:hypothetical protein